MKKKEEEKIKVQTSIEYLLTYGAALLIFTATIAFIYYYLVLPATVVPNKCALASGAYCKDVIMSYNALSQKASLLFHLLILKHTHFLVRGLT